MKTAHDLLGDLDVKAWKRGWEMVNAITDREAFSASPDAKLAAFDALAEWASHLRPDPFREDEDDQARRRWRRFREVFGDATQPATRAQPRRRRPRRLAPG